jgi:hypothetical protein
VKISPKKAEKKKFKKIKIKLLLPAGHQNIAVFENFYFPL